MKKTLLLLFILNLQIQAEGQNIIKGMYVDGFVNILGNTVKEDSLLTYALNNHFNYLSLYDLYPIHQAHNLTNVTTSAILANFIQKAKQSYGVKQVGAIGENFSFFRDIIDIYNRQHTDSSQKFDVYNVEFEFWNVTAGDYYCTTYLAPGGYSCDTAGGFAYYKALIHSVDSLANLTGVLSELYIGWINQGQAQAIGNNIDRVLLHDYISNYSNLYSYIKTRLQYLASRNVMIDVMPIFSAEPSFLGPWLNSNPIDKPYTDLLADLAAETGTWKNYINLKGYQWFDYGNMPPLPVSGTVNLNLTAFLEGFYSGTKRMIPVLYNRGLSTDSTATDTITVNLWAPSSLAHASPDTSVKVVLHNNGKAVAAFSNSVVGKSYYIAVKHRNSIETWSANAVMFTTATSFDFSSAATQAYGSNMRNMGSNVYALYTGDINQDGGVDGSDFLTLNPDILAGKGGYIYTDVNGDGGVDGTDFLVIYPNIQTGKGAVRP